MNILTENYKLYLGDCLEVMDRLIEEGIKVDCILTDPPYGTTACKWDTIIPFDKMWNRLNKLIKPNGAIVLFSSQPFTSNLVMSNVKNFKYEWIWHKNKGGNPLNAKRMPMKQHENICVFYKNPPTYNPIMEERYGQGKERVKYKVQGGRFNKDRVYGKVDGIVRNTQYSELRNPQTVQFFNVERGLHPTQKPIKLMEYLIKTYTNENELVLDFTMGSGTTGIACLNTNRRFIGIELNEKYFDISINRIFENYNRED
jgi:site-specific DNA-methyltransferase (adenine-specific)